MILRVKTYWIDRSVREQRLLTVMLALLTAVILWFALISPIRHARIAATERLERAAIASGQVLTRAAALRATIRAAPPPALKTSLILAVETSATEAGFTPARLERRNEDRILISMSSAKSQALFSWLSMLAKRGIFVETATIHPNADATLSFVATLRLRTS
jgi:general secretion pathway protein M